MYSYTVVTTTGAATIGGENTIEGTRERAQQTIAFYREQDRQIAEARIELLCEQCGGAGRVPKGKRYPFMTLPCKQCRGSGVTASEDIEH